MLYTGQSQIADMLRRVTYHAVTRYVQRVMGVTVAPAGEAETSTDLARRHAEAVGLDIDSVRRLILTPEVIGALVAGSTSVRAPAFTVVIKQPAGTVVTIKRRDWQRPRQRLLTKREATRILKKSAKKAKGRPRWR